MNWTEPIKDLVWRPAYPIRKPLQLLRKSLGSSPYHRWLHDVYPGEVQKNFKYEGAAIPNGKVSFSLLTPVFHPDPSDFSACVESVLNQDFLEFEWILLVNGATHPKLRKRITQLSLSQKIRVIEYPENRGITEATAAGIKEAKGEWVAFLDHDDILQPSALSDFARVAANEKADFIYSDSDHCDGVGRRYSPILKPDTSPEYLLSANYICHFHALKKELALGYFEKNRILDGAQDWDITLQLVHQKHFSYHVPKILYTQRVHPRQFSAALYQKNASEQKHVIQTAQRESLKRLLKVKGLEGQYKFERDERSDFQKLMYVGPLRPPVTFISRSKPLAKPDYGNLNLLLGENPLDLLAEVKTKFFVIVGESGLPPQKDWLVQAIGVFLREPDLALLGGEAIESQVLPFERPPLDVRREVKRLKTDFLVGRTEVVRQFSRYGMEGFQEKLLETGRYRILLDPDLRVEKNA